MMVAQMRAAFAAAVLVSASMVPQAIFIAPAHAQNNAEQCERDQNTQNRNRQIGNIAGRLIGQRVRQTTGVDYGTSGMVGDLIGGTIAQFLDACDRQKASGATREALNNERGGRRVDWTSDNNEGTGGSAEVTRQRQRPEGGTCRTVTEIAYREGREVREDVEYCQASGGGEWTRA